MKNNTATFVLCIIVAVYEDVWRTHVDDKGGGVGN